MVLVLVLVVVVLVVVLVIVVVVALVVVLVLVFVFVLALISVFVLGVLVVVGREGSRHAFWTRLWTHPEFRPCSAQALRAQNLLLGPPSVSLRTPCMH